MRSNYTYGLIGSLVCMGASVTDTRSGHEVVRIDYAGQDGKLLVRRAAEIIKTLDRIDRQLAKERT